MQLDCTSITNVTKLHAEFLRCWNVLHFPFSFSFWFSVVHFSLFWSVMYLLRCFPFLWQCQLTPLNLPLLLSEYLDVLFEAFLSIIHHFQHQRLTLVRVKFAANKPFPSLLVDVCWDERNGIMKWASKTALALSKYSRWETEITALHLLFCCSGVFGCGVQSPV